MATDILSPNILAGALASFFPWRDARGVFVRLFLKKTSARKAAVTSGPTMPLRLEEVGYFDAFRHHQRHDLVGTAHTLDLSVILVVWGLCAFGALFHAVFKSNGGKGVATGLGVLVVLCLSNYV